ncbi:MAG: phosphatidylglycerophosphatase A [Myxococcales bacterium]|nr:MAG: phosphatidylglycerophosphatase A [Myxococcales bacterium]
MPIWKYPVHLLAYGFGTGLVPVAPGSFGTLVGVALYRVMGSLRPLHYWLITALMWIVGVPICEQTAADLGAHDPGAIVWDEIVGYLIAVYGLPRRWGWLAAGFVVYRLFDVWKPYPIGVTEEAFGVGVSIMADDVVAGMYALCVLHLVRWALKR